SFFFASSWANYEAARPGTFRLLQDDATRLDNLRRDYEDMQAMIFGDAPSWHDVAGVLRDLERRVNEVRERG
ncbi:MAG: nucleotidyl transferase AbiEii/AbiGii toxin family protein, partial [Kiritimatiellia bacterium]